MKKYLLIIALFFSGCMNYNQVTIGSCYKFNNDDSMAKITSITIEDDKYINYDLVDTTYTTPRFRLYSSKTLEKTFLNKYTETHCEKYDKLFLETKLDYLQSQIDDLSEAVWRKK